METFSKTAVFNLLSIGCAVALLVLIVMDLMRPRLSRLQPESQNYAERQSKWLTARTFNLLRGESPGPGGMDTQKNPFQRAVTAPESGKNETVGAEPEPEPSPPVPATREISLVYRGLYRSSGGEPFVYLEVENVTRVFPVGGAVAGGWTISEANVNEVILEQDGAPRIHFQFNRKKSLEVPIE